MRKVLGIVLLALLAVPAAPAEAAKPRLKVTSLVVPTGRTLDPQRPFVVTGRVANRGRRSSRAMVAFVLRTRRPRRGNAYAVGAVSSFRVGARSARRFRATLQLPANFPLRPGRRLYLSACVRRKRGARPSCRVARRTMVFGALPAPRPGPPQGIVPPPPAQQPQQPPPAEAPQSPFRPGARSTGDRLFPAIGNGGYDVEHYDLELDYQPVTKVLLGETEIRAKATHGLSEFSLDFHGLSVSTVKVNGADATFTREGDKLVVTPPAGIPSGATFTTTIAYGGIAAPFTDPDGSSEGFVPTPDGAFVVNEPIGAMSWFPNNNVPTDKALYDMTVTVPPTSTVFGNGRLVSHEGGTWHWREDSPMATYLTTATNGTFVRETDSASDPDVPYEYGVDAGYNAAAAAILLDLRRSPDMTQFFEDTLDVPYPFSSSGGVVDVSDVGYALESQTRPMYALPPGLTTIAHEIAHQWFGNSVSPATWSDIWLNEGPAEFYSWLWDERENGGDTTEQRFDELYADANQSWDVPPAMPPDATELFNTDAMYNRGAMVMEALRQIVGEPRFLELCRKWLVDHADGHATTADFIRLFREGGGVSQTQLDVFFREWLYEPRKPGITPDNFATYAP